MSAFLTFLALVVCLAIGVEYLRQLILSAGSRCGITRIYRVFRGAQERYAFLAVLAEFIGTVISTGIPTESGWSGEICVRA